MAQRIIANAGVGDLQDVAAARGPGMESSVPETELVEPSAQALAQLIDMGFSENRARTALRHSANNLSIATTRLVDGTF